MDDYIKDLKKYIKTENISKATTALKKISSRHERDKLEVLKLLALAPDKTAFELLSVLTDSRQQDPQIHDRLIQLIIDRAHLNSQFVQIILDKTDKSSIMNIVPLLKYILTKETDTRLLNQIIRTTGKIKIESMVDDIAEFIFYDNVDFKTEAVKALERIGSSHALEKLVHASKTPKCDQNILDAIEVLEDKNIEKVSEDEQKTTETETDLFSIKKDQLVSRDIEKRLQALDYFAEKGPKICLSLLQHLETIDLNKNHDLSINTLRLIAITIPAEAINYLFEIINTKSINNTIKFAAYCVLGSFPELKSAANVLHGLSEPAIYVRMAAIKALDKNLSDFVGSEIRNKIESGTKKGEELAHSILDAKAKNIIEFLLISDTFFYMASNYLERSASIHVLDTFIEILEQKKLKSTSKKYMDLKKTKTAQPKKLFIVISSSEVILNTFSKYISSYGFSNICFQNSQDAFEAILSKKPDVIICDLLLNNITGLEFAREIRELYSRDEVSIIISTLEKNLDKIKLQEIADNVGINAIVEFPPKPAQIKSWAKS